MEYICVFAPEYTILTDVRFGTGGPPLLRTELSRPGSVMNANDSWSATFQSINADVTLRGLERSGSGRLGWNIFQEFAV